MHGQMDTQTHNGHNAMTLTHWPLASGATRSLGQILEEPCVRSRGLILGPMIMKLGQNVCLDEISNNFQNGSCPVKN